MTTLIHIENVGQALKPYSSRATAIAATVPAPVQIISLLHETRLYGYIRDASGAATPGVDGRFTVAINNGQIQFKKRFGFTVNTRYSMISQ